MATNLELPPRARGPLDVYIRTMATRIAAKRRSKGRKATDSAFLWPPITSPERLAEVENRLRWYLSGTGLSITIPCSSDLLDKEIAIPPGQASFAHLPLDIRRTTRLTSRERGGICLIHKVTVRSLRRVLTHPSFVIDWDFYLFTESYAWFEILRYLPQQARGVEFSHAKLRAVHPGGPAYLLATGPSLDHAIGEMRLESPSLKIACNSAVRSEALLRWAEPQVVVFADLVFHFGPSLYAEAFRQAWAKYALRSSCLTIVPELCAGFLQSRFPALRGRIMGVRYEDGQGWNFPTDEKSFVRPTGNILSDLMIPLAASVCKDIRVLGADGRKPDETYFWKHSQKAQFGDLMPTVQQVHPSFFSDNSYVDYYARHCQLLEELITHGEAFGVCVRPETPSFIPALVRRSR